ncbi:MAG: polysaccharide deacetylase family protein, partial [Calditrichia bacterium]
MNTTILSFDIEEWFQVENLKGSIQREDWDNRHSSVEQNTDKILALLDEHGIPATFFILGWIAERHPEMVRKISDAGYEIGCHGYNHDLTFQLEDKQLCRDIQISKKLLEDITGKDIHGYRAPSFSINDRVIDHLRKMNFLYDSSLNPFKLNERYGKINSSMEK